MIIRLINSMLLHKGPASGQVFICNPIEVGDESAEGFELPVPTRFAVIGILCIIDVVRDVKPQSGDLIELLKLLFLLGLKLLKILEDQVLGPFSAFLLLPLQAYFELLCELFIGFGVCYVYFVLEIPFQVLDLQKNLVFYLMHK